MIILKEQFREDKEGMNSALASWLLVFGFYNGILLLTFVLGGFTDFVLRGLIGTVLTSLPAFIFFEKLNEDNSITE